MTEPQPTGPFPNAAKLAVGFALVAVLIAVYVVLSRTGALDAIMDGAVLRGAIEHAGAAGPLAVIGLMATAIVVTPIPSAPIALAAGAAYGHVWGTLYVLVGSTAGAAIAFAVARLLGYEALRRWFGGRRFPQFLGSQNALMAIVFGTRLLPFVSFDIVSYTAGLTLLATWRFVVATLAGIAPASFLLAHFGSEIGSADPVRVTLAGLGLGVVILLPIGAKVFLDHRKRGAARGGSA